MGATFGNNIYEVNYASGALWKRFMVKDPTLFQDVGFHQDIMCMYAESAALQASVQLNQ